MYRRKHISLDEAVEVIAERLATYSNGLSGIDEAFPIRSDIAPADTSTPAAPPSDDAALHPDGLTYRTGAPGRPTSMHLIEPELRRRFQGGEQLPTMPKEAEYLSRWLATA